MKIIDLADGGKVDMEAAGPLNLVVMVFKDSEDNHHAITPDEMVESGTPIETEGENEGEDMEYIGLGIKI